ncbi:MAG: DUF1428 domain-containing protein [Pseudomonadota bacterium]|nr:DUF1428 domain-containing protein [Pseudomonadota bacterium]
MHPDTYIDGFVAAVPSTGRDAYLRHASDAARVFKKHGALSVVECWGSDVPEGKRTSFPLAVQRQADETVVFSWVIWPSKQVRDEAWQALENDPDMPQDMPFDGQRLIYGGFELLLDA